MAFSSLLRANKKSRFLDSPHKKLPPATSSGCLAIKTAPDISPMPKKLLFLYLVKPEVVDAPYFCTRKEPCLYVPTVA
jgi:hypothetical protein